MSTHANLVNTPIPNHNNIAIGECLSAWDDALLVSAAKAGDRSAFVELYERHSRKVLPTIYRITKNREDAEDAFQDAVLRAFVHIKSFEGRANSCFFGRPRRGSIPQHKMHTNYMQAIYDSGD